jgi:hypothetical protein
MATASEVPFSELLNRPRDTVARLDAAHGRALRLHRRGDEEDLVLTTSSRAKQSSDVTSATTRMFVALMQRGPRAVSLLVDVVPDAFPWVRFLSREDVQAFVLELVETLRAAEELDNPAPVAQVLTAWRHTAEIHADSELAAALRRGTDGDFGSVAAPAE